MTLIDPVGLDGLLSGRRVGPHGFVHGWIRVQNLASEAQEALKAGDTHHAQLKALDASKEAEKLSHSASGATRQQKIDAYNATARAHALVGQARVGVGDVEGAKTHLAIGQRFLDAATKLEKAKPAPDGPNVVHHAEGEVGGVQHGKEHPGYVASWGIDLTSKELAAGHAQVQQALAVANPRHPHHNTAVGKKGKRGWRGHLEERHGASTRDMNEALRDTNLRGYHQWLHEEYQAQLDHRHDEYGQLITTDQLRVGPHGYAHGWIHVGPGTGSLEQRLAGAVNEPGGGGTPSPRSLHQPKRGWAVAESGRSLIAKPEQLQDPRARAQFLADFIKRNRDSFKDPNKHVGIWHDPEHHEIVLDPTDVIEDSTLAEEQGRYRNEQGIFNLENGKYLPTGGTGSRGQASYWSPGTTVGTGSRGDDGRGAGRLGGAASQLRAVRAAGGSDDPVGLEGLLSGRRVGPHGYIHGWIFVGIPGVGAIVTHPRLGKGRVVASKGPNTALTKAIGEGHIGHEGGQMLVDFGPGKGVHSFTVQAPPPHHVQHVYTKTADMNPVGPRVKPVEKPITPPKAARPPTPVSPTVPRDFAPNPNHPDYQSAHDRAMKEPWENLSRVPTMLDQAARNRDQAHAMARRMKANGEPIPAKAAEEQAQFWAGRHAAIEARMGLAARQLKEAELRNPEPNTQSREYLNGLEQGREAHITREEFLQSRMAQALNQHAAAVKQNWSGLDFYKGQVNYYAGRLKAVGEKRAGQKLATKFTPDEKHPQFAAGYDAAPPRGRRVGLEDLEYAQRQHQAFHERALGADRAGDPSRAAMLHGKAQYEAGLMKGLQERLDEQKAQLGPTLPEEFVPDPNNPEYQRELAASRASWEIGPNNAVRYDERAKAAHADARRAERRQDADGKQSYMKMAQVYAGRAAGIRQHLAQRDRAAGEEAAQIPTEFKPNPEHAQFQKGDRQGYGWGMDWEGQNAANDVQARHQEALAARKAGENVKALRLEGEAHYKAGYLQGAQRKAEEEFKPDPANTHFLAGKAEGHAMKMGHLKSGPFPFAHHGQAQALRKQAVEAKRAGDTKRFEELNAQAQAAGGRAVGIEQAAKEMQAAKEKKVRDWAKKLRKDAKAGIPFQPDKNEQAYQDAYRMELERGIGPPGDLAARKARIQQALRHEIEEGKRRRAFDKLEKAHERAHNHAGRLAALDALAGRLPIESGRAPNPHEQARLEKNVKAELLQNHALLATGTNQPMLGQTGSVPPTMWPERDPMKKVLSFQELPPRVPGQLGSNRQAAPVTAGVQHAYMDTATLANGQKVFIKGLKDWGWGGRFDAHTMAQNEMFAGKLGRAVGAPVPDVSIQPGRKAGIWDVITPEVTGGNGNHHENTVVAAGGKTKIDPEGWRKLRILDYLMSNGDREGNDGNWILHTMPGGQKKVVGIDHSLTFHGNGHFDHPPVTAEEKQQIIEAVKGQRDLFKQEGRMDAYKVALGRAEDMRVASQAEVEAAMGAAA